MNSIAKDLLADSELVANVAVRLGKLKTTDLLDAIGSLRATIADGSFSTEVVVKAQNALTKAIADIAPITLLDLREGWTPWAQPKLGRQVFWWGYALGSVALMLLCGVATLLYINSTQVYATLVDLQTSRPDERAAKLFALVRDSRFVSATILGQDSRSVFSDLYYKMYYDVRSADELLHAYDKASMLDNPVRRIGAFVNVTSDQDSEKTTQDKKTSYPYLSNEPPNARSSGTGTDLPYVYAVPDGPLAIPEAPKIADLAATKTTPASGPGKPPSSPDVPPATAEKSGESGLPPGSSELVPFQRHSQSFQNFLGAASFGSISLYSAGSATRTLRDLQAGLTLLGSWVLPALFGMLGTCAFFLRRFLDRSLPNPRLFQTLVRTALGAFVGVIAVGVLSPTATKVTDASFIGPASFSLAFFAGLSTDLFLGVVDRFTESLLGGFGK